MSINCHEKTEPMRDSLNLNVSVLCSKCSSIFTFAKCTVTGTVYLGAVEGFHMPLLEEEVPDDALRAR